MKEKGAFDEKVSAMGLINCSKYKLLLTSLITMFSSHDTNKRAQKRVLRVKLHYVEQYAREYYSRAFIHSYARAYARTCMHKYIPTSRGTG